MRVNSVWRESCTVLNNYLTRKEQFILLFVAAAAVIGAIVLLVNRDDAATPTADASPVPQPAEAAALPVPEPQPDASAEVPAVETPSPPPPPEPTTIRVAVRGAVFAPSLYTFQSDEDPRVQDLLDAAGGLEDYADVSDINVAARLIDGTTLTVPGQPPQEEGSRVIRVSHDVPAPPPNPPQYTVSGWRPEVARSAATTSDTAGSATPASSEGLLDLNTATQAQLEDLPGIGEVLASRIIEYRQQTPFRSVDELMNVKGIAEKRLADVRHLVTVR